MPRTPIDVDGEYTSLLCLAAVLAANRASFVVVGSAALRLRGEQIAVNDLDAVINPAAVSLPNLRSALSEVALGQQRLPSVAALGAAGIFRTATPYGFLDCLLERGREEWGTLRAEATAIPVFGVPVLVASAQHAWQLRRRFKGDPR